MRISPDRKIKHDKLKLYLIAGGVIIAAIILRQLGVGDYIRVENINYLSDWVKSYGATGSIVYIVVWIAACIFFFPGTPVSLLGGFIFGPWLGLLLTSIGSTLGATAAFLVARYAARPLVENWVKSHGSFKKFDEGIKEHGWRMVMITRLVPIFPFNFQNYAYGLTKIKALTYITVSWICMLPGTTAYVFTGGAIISGEGSLEKTFTYLAIAASFFVIISLIPGWVAKKYHLPDK